MAAVTAAVTVTVVVYLCVSVSVSVSGVSSIFLIFLVNERDGQQLCRVDRECFRVDAAGG